MKPDMKGKSEGGKNVWMLSFESSDVVYVGGLGQAVSTLAHALADLGNQVTVLMPSHGRHGDEEIKRKLGLKDVPDFAAFGSRMGVDANNYPYGLGFVEGSLGGVRYLLARGIEPLSSRWMQERQVYDHDITYEKMALFSRAVKHYFDFVMDSGGRLPDVVHMNDWHTVPAGAVLKQRAASRGKSVPVVFTIHLLNYKTLPWHYMSEDWCGLVDAPFGVLIDGQVRLVYPRALWDDLCRGSFERFGALWSDWITSVSRSYLSEDVVPYLGNGVGERSGYIYNSCDWNEREILREASKEHDLAGINLASRTKLRSYLLTSALAKAGPQFPADPEAGKVVTGFLGTRLFSSSGEIMPFDSDGELVLMTGRLSEQKGVDLLVRAIPEVIHVVPDARFLIIVVPGQQTELLDRILADSGKYGSNVRVAPGPVKPIYRLAHVASDVFAMPSRWEPFGIAALEAMSTGNPVVGSRVGGIKETVVHLGENPEEGTGLLVEPNNHEELARGLISMLMIMKIATLSDGYHMRELAGKIPDGPLRELAMNDKKLGNKIRENCRRRVERYFRPSNSAKMAMQAYQEAEKICRLRT